MGLQTSRFGPRGTGPEEGLNFKEPMPSIFERPVDLGTEIGSVVFLSDSGNQRRRRTTVQPPLPSSSKTDGGNTGKIVDFFETDLPNGSDGLELDIPPIAMKSIAACRCMRRRCIRLIDLLAMP
jgi:hypothetical protein